MTAPQPLLVAQNIAEYGALSGIASALQSVLYQAQAALQEPRTAVPVGLVVLVLAYLLIRRR